MREILSPVETERRKSRHHFEIFMEKTTVSDEWTTIQTRERKLASGQSWKEPSTVAVLLDGGEKRGRNVQKLGAGKFEKLE